MSAKTVLAIDPGTSKCGLALVQRSIEGKVAILWRSIAPPDNLIAQVDEAACVASIDLFVVGSGTHSRAIVHAIRDARPSAAILTVDERETTLQARERYWEHNPRRGWRRLLPASMQVPPHPVDDFVAVILAERVLSE